MRSWRVLRTLGFVWLGVLAAGMAKADDLAKEAEFLGNIRQVTSGLPRAGEGYYSPKADWIVYQAYPVGYPFYQIYVQKLDENKPRLLSTGRGRTTCAYFHPTEPVLLFSSSHTDPDIEQTELKAREKAAQGGRRRYEWDFDPHMDIYQIRFDGTGLKRLTDTPGYDAEASYSADGKRIVFTSSRDGDADLYVMNSDGTDVRQLTNQPGYDGGPFFSPDGNWVIYRTDRRKEHMLQLHIISIDGKVDLPLTDNLDEVNWCPYFHPTGKYLVWSRADYSRGPLSAHFKLWTMDLRWEPNSVKGESPRQITFGTAADVLPVFSPNGRSILWTSARTSDGSSQLWTADWKRETETAQ